MKDCRDPPAEVRGVTDRDSVIGDRRRACGLAEIKLSAGRLWSLDAIIRDQLGQDRRMEFPHVAQLGGFSVRDTGNCKLQFPSSDSEEHTHGEGSSTSRLMCSSSSIIIPFLIGAWTNCGYR